MKYARLLVPLDGSPLAEQAVPYARLLGRGLDVPVHLMACLTRTARSGVDAANLSTVVRTYLDRVALPLQEAGVHVSTVLAEGDAAAEIADEADRQPETLTLMSTHGRSGIRRWALGSVTDRVLRATTGPLMVIRPGNEPMTPPVDAALDTVVVPLDGSELAERALPHAHLLADALELRVMLVHVVGNLADYYGPMETVPEADGDGQEGEHQEGAAYLSQVREREQHTRIASAEEVVLSGHPTETVIELVRELPGAMVVMTTHGRSGPGRWLLGSVADQVVRHAERPVLLVRSAGQRA